MTPTPAGEPAEEETDSPNCRRVRFRVGGFVVRATEIHNDYWGFYVWKGNQLFISDGSADSKDRLVAVATARIDQEIAVIRARLTVLKLRGTRSRTEDMKPTHLQHREEPFEFKIGGLESGAES